MIQHTIHVTEGTKDWGSKKILQMNWSEQGRVWCILVDWYGTGKEPAAFYDYDNTGVFKNQHGNLQGTIDQVDPFNKVTRLEVINHKDKESIGRAYTHWQEDNKIEGSFQDSGRTLKIFITKR